MNIPLFKASFLHKPLFQEPLLKPLELATLLARMATLLKEGYTFANSIEMLLPYHVKAPKSTQVQQQVKEILVNGGSVTQVFMLLGLKKNDVLSIELAEASGRLTETIEIVAKQLTFRQQSKSRLIKVLSYPIMLFLFLMVLFLAFRTYFLPNMTSVMTSRTENTSSTIGWSTLFLHFPNFLVAASSLLAVLILCFIVVLKKKQVDLQLHVLFKIPYISLAWRLVLTRQLSKNLGDLLLAGLSLQQALAYLKQQPHQQQLAYVANRLQQRIIYGDALSQAVESVGYFYPKFEHFIRHGEASGLLGRELILYSELLDTKIEKWVKKLLAIVQPLLLIIIAVCIVLAYLSILLPMYEVIDFI